MQLYNTRASNNGYMTVIPTNFKGNNFRCRTEAKLAVTFEALDADWHYEVEGYNLGNGISYLPDFVIHNVQVVPIIDALRNESDYRTYKKFNCSLDGISKVPLKEVPRVTYDVYIEVKGRNFFDPIERLKTETFFSKLNQLDKPSIGIVVGYPPNVNNYNDLMKTLKEQIYCKEQGKRINTGFYSLNMYGDQAIPVYDSRFGGFTLFFGSINELPKEDRYRTLGAYISGLSAKFEHHQTPHIYTADEVKLLGLDIYTEGEKKVKHKQLLKNIRNK